MFGAVLGSLAGSAVLGALNGQAQENAQSAANATNLRIAAMNNKAQIAMFNKQMRAQNRWNAENFAYQDKSWQRQVDLYNQMWQQNVAYNDPSAAMKRYRDAGINPYFALGNINAGSTQVGFSPSDSTPSTGGVPSAPSLNTPQVEPVMPHTFDGLLNAITTLPQSYKTMEEGKSISIDNLTKFDRQIAELDKLLAEKGLAEDTAAKIREEKETIQKLRDQQFESLRAEIRNKNASTDVLKEERNVRRFEARKAELEADYQKAVNDFLPTQQENERKIALSILAKNYADAYAAKESGKLSAKQAAVAVVEKSIKDLEKKGVAVEVKYKKKMIRQTLRGMVLSNQSQRLANKQSSQDYYNPFHYVGSAFGGAAGGAATRLLIK